MMANAAPIDRGPLSDPCKQSAPEGFLPTILPDEGYFCVTSIKNGVVKNHFFETTDEALAAAYQIDRSGGDAYHGCFTYKTKDNRKAGNAAHTKSLWLDLDVGDDKGFSSQDEAIEQTLLFSSKMGLWKPIFVNSGFGIHVYWALNEPVTRDQWLPVAKRLKTATRMWGLPADPSRTADAASILRTPGTHNRKLSKPRPVTWLEARSAMETGSLSDFSNQLRPGDEGHLSGDLLEANATLNADLSGGLEYPPSSAHLIAEQCAIIGLVRDSEGDVKEPLWRAALGVLKNTSEAPDICHRWSAGHPEYSAAETDHKMRGLDAGMGEASTLCATLSDHEPELCEACPHKGKINSPIVLGYENLPRPFNGANHAEPRHLPALVGGEISNLPNNLPEKDAVALLNKCLAHIETWGEAAGGYHLVKPGGRLIPCTKQHLEQSLAGHHVIRDGKKAISAFKYWNHHPDRLNIANVVFYPPGSPKSAGPLDHNLWRGFGVKRHKGNWWMLWSHLFLVICDGDQLAFTYLIKWMALMVQKPGVLPGVMVIMLSEVEGTGKSTLIRVLASILGSHAGEYDTSARLLEKFNTERETQVFVGIHEGVVGGTKADTNALKPLITEPTMRIEPKGQPVRTVRNHMHVMLATNEPRVVMAGANARRWLVLNVSSRRAGDNEYFRVLNAELDNGGIAAFLDFLLRVDLSDFNPAADLPRTEALKQQQEFAAPLHAIWALDLVEQDMDGQWLPVGMGTSVFGTAVATAELYENYKLFAQANRKSPITYAAFSKWLASLGLNSAKIRNAKRGWLLPKTPQEFAKIVRKTAGIHS